MKEIVYNYEEFFKRVSKDKPIHHTFHIRAGKYSLYTIVLIVEGIDSKEKRILAFETVLEDILFKDIPIVIQKLEKVFLQ